MYEKKTRQLHVAATIHTISIWIHSCHPIDWRTLQFALVLCCSCFKMKITFYLLDYIVISFRLDSFHSIFINHSFHLTNYYMPKYSQPICACCCTTTCVWAYPLSFVVVLFDKNDEYRRNKNECALKIVCLHSDHHPNKSLRLSNPHRN